jgi:hypothetical protein
MYRLLVSVLVLLSILSSADAGAFKGKKVYASQLKEPCGFTGEVMGKKYKKSEWKRFYREKRLAQVLKQECPNSTLITKKSDLRALLAFFSLFAKDSGNKASCGG